MKCRHCGTDIADKALICYRCGHATTEPRIKPPDEGSLFDRPRRRRGPMVTVVVLVILVLLALFLLWGRAGADTPKTTGAQSSRSFTPSEMRWSVSPILRSLPSLTARSPMDTMPTS